LITPFVEELRVHLAQAVAQAHAARMRPAGEIKDATEVASRTMRRAIARFDRLRQSGADFSLEDRQALASLVMELQRAFEDLRDHAAEMVRQISN
jgi:hypothetical protein